MKFSIKDFFSKCGEIRRKLQNWSYFLKKSLIENFIANLQNIYFLLIHHLLRETKNTFSFLQPRKLDTVFCLTLLCRQRVQYCNREYNNSKIVRFSTYYVADILYVSYRKQLLHNNRKFKEILSIFSLK